MGLSYQILIPSKVPEEPLYGVIYKKKKEGKKYPQNLFVRDSRRQQNQKI